MKNEKYDEDGDIKYYKNGKLHRTDGPAVVRVDKSIEFWLNDKKVQQGTFEYANFKKKCPEYFL